MTRQPNRPNRRGTVEQSLQNTTARSLYDQHRRNQPTLPAWETLPWNMHDILGNEAKMSILATLEGLMTELYRDMMGRPTDDQSTVMMYLIGVKKRLENPPKRFVSFTDDEPEEP